MADSIFPLSSGWHPTGNRRVSLMKLWANMKKRTRGEGRGDEGMKGRSNQSRMLGDLVCPRSTMIILQCACELWRPLITLFCHRPSLCCHYSKPRGQHIPLSIYVGLVFRCLILSVWERFVDSRRIKEDASCVLDNYCTQKVKVHIKHNKTFQCCLVSTVYSASLQVANPSWHWVRGRVQPGQIQLIKPSVFGLWEEAGVHGENIHRHWEDMQTPHRETPPAESVTFSCQLFFKAV